MTQARGGFDDWTGHSVWRSPLWYDTTVNLNAGQAGGLLHPYSSSFAAAMLRVEVASGAIRLRAEHHRSNPDTNVIRSHEWICRPETHLQCIIPLLSAELGLGWQNRAAGASQFNFHLQWLSIHTERTIYLPPTRQLHVEGVLAPPVSTTVYRPAYLWPGPATIWLHGPAAGSTLNANLKTYDQNGVVSGFLQQWPVFTPGTRSAFHVPATYWELQIENTGGAAQQYWFGIVGGNSLS